MDNTKVYGSFVSEKISSIRWLKTEDYSSADTFVTGAWGSAENFVKAWKLVKNCYSEDEGEYVPKYTDKIKFRSDINNVEFVDVDNLAVSLSDGFVSMLKIRNSSEEALLAESGKTATIHKFSSGGSASCTSLSVFEKNIATVGEDGTLNIINSSTLDTVKSFKGADSCSLVAVSYVNHNEVITGNRMGVVRLFDIRSDKPSETQFLISCIDDKKSNSVTCISHHPTQKHVIIVGSEEGSLTVWDLRQPSFPASYLSAHKSAITELAFHKTQPTKLFTASEDGELWQWNQDGIGSLPQSQQAMETEMINPWLNGERAKNKINVTALITGIRKAINSFDSLGLNIVCGCDNEAIYFIENMF